MEEKKYYLGLDIGTDSVGFAVTDESYHLIRKQGKHLWGSRLFDEAKDASTRRSARAARRRYQRRRARILILRDLFKEEMNKVDPKFFARLDNSSLHPEDKPKGIHAPFILSDEKSFVTKYKTIYHLRKAMLESDEKFDIRYVYLVIAHMIKYRGNFLHEDDIKNGGVDSDEILANFQAIDNGLIALAQEDDDGIEVDADTFSLTKKQVQDLIILFQSDMGLTDRLEKEGEILGDKPKKTKQAILKLINGSDVKLAAIFPRLSEDDEEAAKKNVKADSETYETDITNFNLHDEEVEILAKCKLIHDSLILANLLKGHSSITDAMLAVYDDYKADLKALRTYTSGLVKTGQMTLEERTKFFDGQEGVTYATFAGSTGHSRIENHIEQKCKEDVFVKAVKELLGKEDKGLNGEELKAKERLGKRIESEKLFLRQNNKTNGVFPHQLNKIELRAILEKQGKYYPFLLAKGKSFPNPDDQDYKIVSLLRYRIPYYVGPLSSKQNGKHLPNHWIEKCDETTKIYPWNFFDVVNRVATARAFMDNLRNTCTYIKGEPTMPKFSLVYQLYKVLNELNNLSVSNRPFTEDEKKQLIEDLYLKTKTIKLSGITNAMKNILGGTVKIRTRANDDEEKANNFIKANLSSWIDCQKIFGIDFYKNKDAFKTAEKTIEIITAFEDRLTREEQLSKLLTPEQAKIAAGLSYKDYSPLSRKLLTGLKNQTLNRETGEIIERTVLDLMIKTPDNFMEIYGGDKYSFKVQVEKLNAENQDYQGEGGIKELVDEAYVSPALKRSIFQTLHIIDELKHILHISSFDKVFVECTRGASKDKKTPPSRKKMIEEYMAAAKKLKIEFDEAKLKGELDVKSDQELRSKHLFHYFMQLGRDVYTGLPIDLTKLSSDYDIDHIIPQADVKDDSFLNTVLTSRAKNNTKQKEYPLPEGFITPAGKEWIDVLRRIKVGNKALLPEEKRARLLRKEPLTEQEKLGFVNRQITFTSQSAKAVCDILKMTDPSSKIIYSKAGLVSDFRGMFSLPKVRDLNDFHHANDAYLNIVVGDVYYQRFNSRLTAARLAELEAKGVSIKTGVEGLFRQTVKSNDLKRTVWIPCRYEQNTGEEIAQPGSTINLVRKILSWNDPMVTRMPTYPNGDNGFLSHITIKKGGKNSKGQFPTKFISGLNKETLIKKYGGYESLAYKYFVLLKIAKKNNYEMRLVAIPVIVDMKLNNGNPNAILDFLYEEGFNSFEIVTFGKKDIRIPISAVIDNKKLKTKIRITGKSDDRIMASNLSQIVLPQEWKLYFKDICKFLDTNHPANIRRNPAIFVGSNPHIAEIVLGKTTISRDKNLKFYSFITEKILHKACFYNINSLKIEIDKLINMNSVFNTLPTIDQCWVLHDTLSMLRTRVGNSSLSKLNITISKTAGVVRQTNKLDKSESIYVPSYTGFYKRWIYKPSEE